MLRTAIKERHFGNFNKIEPQNVIDRLHNSGGLPHDLEAKINFQKHTININLITERMFFITYVCFEIRLW
jgi:hypothetical protein